METKHEITATGSIDSLATPAFAVGDLVRLKSGGPLMTVSGRDALPPYVEVRDGDPVRCAWFVGGKISRTSFPPASLMATAQPEEGLIQDIGVVLDSSIPIKGDSGTTASWLEKWECERRVLRRALVALLGGGV